MFYVPKEETTRKPYSDKKHPLIKEEITTYPGRCRRYAPTMKGYPVVYGNSDWCGEHKIGSNPVRDGKEAPECDHEWIDADNEVVSGAEICRLCHNIRSKMGHSIKIEDTGIKFQIGMDPEEKAKVKAEINQKLVEIYANARDIEIPVHARDNITDSYRTIRELLEKL
jgi:hypothetical protein